MEQRPDIPIIDIEQYGGKQVAILDGDVVAVGQTLSEVLANAKARFPGRPTSDFAFLIVPRSRYVLYVCGISLRHFLQ